MGSREARIMRCLVTGCAGFIGSHVTERLLQDGFEVIGVDAFTDYYPRAYKMRNLEVARQNSLFSLIDGDLNSLPLEPLVKETDLIFHQAAQAGVRASWGGQFDIYTQQNILATQRLLEACRGASALQRFVYASSSSVYGNAPSLPVSEEAMPRPVSPYGVTKLAAEHLCLLYHTNFNVPSVALRYFTVYGARQRPDMAFHRFIRAGLAGEAITVHEDGNQTRDFTHVRDIVQANMKAATAPAASGNVYNVAGGSRLTLNEALVQLGEAVGRPLEILHAPKQAGDVRDTYADIGRAQRDLEYRPTVDLGTGLRDEVEWYESSVGANERNSAVGTVR
jgi:nucleoside-diphosphate-sugar epimerase